MRNHKYYVSQIIAAGQLKDAQLVKNHFNDAKLNGKVNADVLRTFISAISSANDYEAAKEVFAGQKDEIVYDASLFAAFIKAAGIAKDFKAAENAFVDAKKAGECKTIVIASFIKAASHAKDFEAVKTAYANAKNDRKTNENVFSAFIKAAHLAGDFWAIIAAFDDVIKAKKITTGVLYPFVTAASDAGDFNAIKKAYKETKTSAKCKIDDELFCKVYEVCMNKIKKGGDIIGMQEAIDAAKEWDVIDDTMRQVYLSAILNSYEQEFGDASINTICLKAAAEAHNFEIIWKIFRELMSLELADSSLVNYIATRFIFCQAALLEIKNMQPNDPKIIQIKHDLVRAGAWLFFPIEPTFFDTKDIPVAGITNK